MTRLPTQRADGDLGIDGNHVLDEIAARSRWHGFRT